MNLTRQVLPAKSMSAQQASVPSIVSSAQVSMVRGLLPNPKSAVIDVDPSHRLARFGSVKLRHLVNKLSRLNLTKADREVAALKAQFRREDQKLLRQGRGEEIVLRNRRLMGIKDGATTRLVGWGGVRFE